MLVSKVSKAYLKRYAGEIPNSRVTWMLVVFTRVNP
jgi:hypothetical protein